MMQANYFQSSPAVNSLMISLTDEVAGELGCNVADLLADVWRGLLLDAGQQLCFDGCLHLQGQARVDLLKGR